MATTPNLGLHYYGSDVPGSITDNGSQHTAADRLYLDQVITQLALAPRHYLPPIAAIPTAFSLDTDANGGQLQDGVTYFYRLALVGLDGFERIASDEASVSMPDVLTAPGAPGLRDAPGGNLPTGLYYYAVTAKSTTQESTLSGNATVNVSTGVNQAIYVDAPSDAQRVPLQVWRKKDTDAGFTRLGVINAGETYTDDGSIPANPYALDPAYAPPTNNKGTANSSVTITLVADAARAADAAMIKAWRIYRSTISGYYSAQSLVHEVVETDDTDGNGGGGLRTSWVDVGDPLRVGQPQFKDRSLPLTPYAPQTVLALPTYTSAYPANYLVVFGQDLYILKDGNWSLVGGGMRISFGLPYPTASATGDLNYQPTLDNWYRYDGVTWQLAIPHQPALLSGDGPPADSLGHDSDFYLNVSAEPADLYGPKTAGVWPTTAITLGGGGSGGSPVLTSPNGTRYRQVVDDDGVVSTVMTLEPGPPAAPTNPVLED